MLTNIGLITNANLYPYESLELYGSSGNSKYLAKDCKITFVIRISRSIFLEYYAFI